MARKAPINYVIATTVALIFWIVTGFLVGNYLAENVSLRQFTVERFVFLYRLTSGVIAAVGLLGCYYWFYYGNREETASDLGKAKGMWLRLLITMFTFSVGGVGTMVAIFRTETFPLVQYAIFFGVMSLHTYAMFWICSLFLSPRTVEYVPLGK